MMVGHFNGFLVLLVVFRLLFTPRASNFPSTCISSPSITLPFLFQIPFCAFLNSSKHCFPIAFVLCSSFPLWFSLYVFASSSFVFPLSIMTFSPCLFEELLSGALISLSFLLVFPTFVSSFPLDFWINSPSLNPHLCLFGETCEIPCSLNSFWSDSLPLPALSHGPNWFSSWLFLNMSYSSTFIKEVKPSLILKTYPFHLPLMA